MKFNVKNVFTGKYDIKFNLELRLENGAPVTIYGCRVVACRKGDFIGWPSYADKKGNYWKHVYVDFEQSDAEDIIAEVLAQARANKGSERHR